MTMCVHDRIQLLRGGKKFSQSFQAQRHLRDVKNSLVPNCSGWALTYFLAACCRSLCLLRRTFILWTIYMQLFRESSSDISVVHHGKSPKFAIARFALMKTTGRFLHPEVELFPSLISVLTTVRAIKNIERLGTERDQKLGLRLSQFRFSIVIDLTYLCSSFGVWSHIGEPIGGDSLKQHCWQVIIWKWHYALETTWFDSVAVILLLRCL